MKKFCILIILMAALLPVHASAYELPHAFWDMNTQCENAVNANNYSDIITYGTQIVNLIANEPDSDQKRNIMILRYRQVGLAYKELGYYKESADTFNALYEYAKNYSDVYYDDIKLSKARAQQYAPVLDMYTDKGTSTFYHAKNEKENGVLFGICEDSETRDNIENESMVLIYHELGQNLTVYNEKAFAEAASSGLAIEFALNCPNHSQDIQSVYSRENYLSEISKLFSSYPNAPVYLRFAAEFDIWGDLPNANEFKDAFQYVSKYFKDRNPNVAIVWSPNQASSWSLNLDDYYPGDEYVDWVGMSSYAMKYFLGDRNSEDSNEVAFKTGNNSDPVITVKDIVEKYGDRKPIMLSESGCGHYVNSVNENTTDFALKRIKEYYSYLPMVYPQIKLIAYFDRYISGETNDYRLSACGELRNEYLRLTKGQRFVQDGYSNNVSLCYRKIDNGTALDGVFLISSYAHMYNDDVTSVTYYIDGNYVSASNEIPFTTYIDASNYTRGSHSLTAIAASSSGKTIASEATVNIYNGGSNDINVLISGEKISFDQPPVIYNERTMVPMRKIFEELGASVEWDGNTKTAIGTVGAKTVKITLGSNLMYVNNQKIELDTPAIILSDRTLVPVRAIAEGLGCNVDWDGTTSTVLIK